jgi:UDP-glucose 4-epimerase
MKLLIIGSEGFIGSHCIDHFMAKGNDVWGLDLYEQPTKLYSYTKVSRLSPEFEEIFQQHQFDVVINAAGSGNVNYSMSHPIIDFEANCLDTIRTLDVIRKYQQQCKYIHVSSAAVYGNPVKLPVNEKDAMNPMSPYGWHKLISENLCLEYTLVYNLKTAIVRPFSVYGPGLKKQLFWDLYQKCINAKDAIQLFGTGTESRDFIYISDLVAALDIIINKGRMQAECYNLASGVETTIADVVKTYFEVAEIRSPYSFNGHVREGDPRNWRADISTISDLGFRPSVELSAGLSNVVKWLRSL